jgi:hypothetical protein
MNRKIHAALIDVGFSAEEIEHVPLAKLLKISEIVLAELREIPPDEFRRIELRKLIDIAAETEQEFVNGE